MYLKELSINGFKSFAKKSELEFSAPVTAIVGPNGSGKSNVAESFRFVLGEQSVKSMRGKRGEDLIWGGSEKVSRANRASVEVVFDNKSRSFAIDFDEVKIERTVHRDGQNEYKINGSTVRLKDVHELLAGANIGSTGHHIISQGEADRVLAAGPKERREMIEDALGLKVFQLKKQETERKLAKTQENIAQTESLRREAAPHLRYLKKQVERAERSLEVQGQLKEKYAEYLKREDVYVARHTDRLRDERRQPEQSLEELRKTIAHLKEQLREEEKPVENEALTKANEMLKELASARQAAERELGKIEGQLSFLEKRIAAASEPNQASAFLSREEVVSVVDDIKQQVSKASDAGESILKETLSKIVESLEALLDEQGSAVVDTTQADQAEMTELEKAAEKAMKVVEEAREAESKQKQVVDDLASAEVTAVQKNREAERRLYELLTEERETSLKLQAIETELQVLERDRSDFKLQLQEAVALLGRGASEYFSYIIPDETGAPVSDKLIAQESRETQRTRLRELEKLKIRLEELGVGATEEVVKEYEEAKARDEFLAKELSDLEQSVQNLTNLIQEMDEKLHEQFSAGLTKIATEFHTFFTLMFGGGSAKLERVALKSRNAEEDEDEPSEIHDGVELQVALPNKRVKGLEMLSGGERALTSIALIFAMSQVNPPPFIILDETDAALDEANSRRYGDMIEALAKRSQLVLITHNRETMSRAGILYGITMGGDGVSKVLSVKFDEAAAVAK